MTSAHHKLDNLTVIVDRNGLQQTGYTEIIKSLEPLGLKWEAFGWKVFVVDGLDVSQLVKVFDQADQVNGQPSVIIALTVKGKGVSFMEWVSGYHGKVPGEDKAKKALEELEESN